MTKKENGAPVAGAPLQELTLWNRLYWHTPVAVTVYICARKKSRNVNCVVTPEIFPLGHCPISCPLVAEVRPLGIVKYRIPQSEDDAETLLLPFTGVAEIVPDIM
jgi:hypothetical protein